MELRQRIPISMFLVAFLMLCMASHLYGQSKTITGKVTDASTREALPGVNILVKGTSQGTATDTSGHYSVNVSSLQDTLVFSYIGYQKRTVPVEGRTTINITLKSSIISGKQLVVTGYGGAESKQEVSGAVSAISSKDLQHEAEPTNTVNMLAGKLPGLRVKQTTGEPGSYSSSFNIRGFGSPLVVIDGVPGGDLHRLNPSDIENISVIKDATGSEYGVRGANGVIIVTTKKGEKGKVDLTVRSTYGWSTPTTKPHTMNAYQYAWVKDGALVNNGEAPQFSKKELKQYKDGTLPSTDWQSLVMRNYAPHYKEYLSASGGSKKVNYYISLEYLKQQGKYRSGDLNHKRVNFRSNINAQITDNLKTSLMLSGHQDQQNQPGYSAYYIDRGIYWEYPTRPPYANNDPNHLQQVPDGTNPLATTNSNITGYSHNLGRELTGVLKLDYQIPNVKGLEVKGFYSYRSYYNNNKDWSPQYNLYTYDSATESYTTYKHRSHTTLNRVFDQETQTDYHISLNFNRTFLGKHKIKTFLLFDQETHRYSNFNGNKQFALSIVDQLYAGESENQQINSNIQVPFGDEGLVGRLTYSYESKYTITGKFRYDGSSRFGPGHKWGFFPSISASWLISSEGFIKNSNALNFIDNLKLRASYGKVGDDAASSFQFLSGYEYPGPSYMLGGSLIKGFSSRGMANPNITWYTSKILDIGLDADMWNGELNFSFDAFRRKRTGLLGTLNLSLPATVGASLPQQNLNSDLNRGIEFMVSTKNTVGSFLYEISGNVAYERHKNLFIERHTSGNSYSNWRNNDSYRWTDLYWGYSVIGRFQSKKEIKNSPIQDGKGNTTLLPGDFKYKDYNGDGIINSKDEHPIGRSNREPELTFGLNLRGAWKGFDLNMGFTGGALSNISYLGSEQFVQPLPFGRSGLAQFTNRWHHEDILDRKTPWVPGKYPANKGIQNSASTNYESNTFWLQNSSYVRLKSIELGYTITPKVSGVKSIRIFANGYNILTWSGLKNIDPERIGEYDYTIQKKYNVGVNIKF
jgi:TonB-linked SusC/RagA family outer membrane protein